MISGYQERGSRFNPLSLANLTSYFVPLTSSLLVSPTANLHSPTFRWQLPNSHGQNLLFQRYLNHKSITHGNARRKKHNFRY